ncbi:unnamed protein product, partial [marine sediment metagenome]
MNRKEKCARLDKLAEPTVKLLDGSAALLRFGYHYEPKIGDTLRTTLDVSLFHDIPIDIKDVDKYSDAVMEKYIKDRVTCAVLSMQDCLGELAEKLQKQSNPKESA